MKTLMATIYAAPVDPPQERLPVPYARDGSRAFAFLARLIETWHRRGASTWQYLGTVIGGARKGLQILTSPKCRETCRGVYGYATFAHELWASVLKRIGERNHMPGIFP